MANTWQKVTVALADIGAANIPDLNRLTFREVSGGSAATFYLDDVRLDLAPPPAVVNVAVERKKKIREVDARLFGLNTAIWDGVVQHRRPRPTCSTKRTTRPCVSRVARLPINITGRQT